MDEEVRQNLLIEEHFPDGKAKSGFSYTYSLAGDPVNMVVLEILMHGETLRLFFAYDHFDEFATATGIVAREIK